MHCIACKIDIVRLSSFISGFQNQIISGPSEKVGKKLDRIQLFQRKRVFFSDYIKTNNITNK